MTADGKNVVIRGHAGWDGEEMSEEEIDRFINLLRDEGLPVRRRITKGRTVMAACGQLGNVELRQLRRSKTAAPIAE